MPLDPQTIGSEQPRTLDGRTYPEHLKAYHAYDDVLLPLVAELGEATPREIAAMVEDPRLRSIVPRWMASAEWRSLIVRGDRDGHSPRTYSLGAEGEKKIAA